MTLAGPEAGAEVAAEPKRRRQWRPCRTLSPSASFSPRLASSPSLLSALLTLRDCLRGVAQRRGGHDSVEALGLGVLDERAGVDDDGVGLARVLHELESGAGEVAQEDLACGWLGWFGEGFRVGWRGANGGGELERRRK